MAIRFNLGKSKYVNLTVKDHCIRYVEMKHGHDTSVQSWGERFLPAGLIQDGAIQDLQTFSMILEECIQEWKIAKKQVRFLIPDSSVVIRKISIPEDVTPDEIKGYLYMELGTSIHLPFENPVFDYHLLAEKDKNKQQIILFAAPEDNIAELSEILDEVKLKPEAADISALALYRYYHHTSNSPSNDGVMIIEVDLKTVNVSIFENHHPLFMRHLIIEVDNEQWVQKNASEGLTFTGDKAEVWNGLDDIYKEIEKVMSFYRYTLNKGDRQVKKIVITGDHPWLPAIVEQIKERFDNAEQMKDFVPSLNDEPIPTSVHVNIGLGLKEV
ncbi:type IV pilus biogenesis protein PilM [Bacillus sp. Au-Bac7]|uniref:type IV pilus biogenesis protein PilM n=1 Tax=Bacillus sp. Au-Bac7 TaxID=2906458 RepID=UPI001E31AA3B|nr:pilus assembly protein PilM [Bacillus sp. Au-Bac7]MCE4051600.1 pilus assembly protein PilM [Bacillus sp. Au-Bac7]